MNKTSRLSIALNLIVISIFAKEYINHKDMVVILNKDATKEDVEKALKKLNQATQKKPRLADFYGKLKGVFGDGLAYQKNIRNEWD